MYINTYSYMDMETHGPKWFYQSRDLQKRQIAEGAGTHNAQGSGRRSRRILRFCHKQSLTPSDSVATPKLKHFTISLPLLSPKQIYCYNDHRIFVSDPGWWTWSAYIPCASKGPSPRPKRTREQLVGLALPCQSYHRTFAMDSFDPTIFSSAW